MSFKYIPDWQKLDLTCSVCGEKRSVKYVLSDGKVICNGCVLSLVVCPPISISPEQVAQSSVQAFKKAPGT